MLGGLLGDQVPPRDGDLLFLRVPGELQHLHPVPQGRRHGVQDVGGRDEQRLGKVEGHVHVVIPERAVLLGVEHLEQRRGRVPAEVHPELIDLVQHEHGVLRLDPPEPLDDLARERADIRAAMAADLGLVADPAERDAHELPAEGARDRFAEGGLPHAGRAHEAEDRVLPAGPDLLDGQIFQDTVLHLLEPPVVLVEDLPRPGDVELVGRLLLPGKRDQPVEVGPRHGVLGGRRRHLGQAVELAESLLPGLLGHPGRLDLLAQLADLLAALVALAELLLDRLHLLAQVVLALGLRHLRLDLGLDLGAQLQHLGFFCERRDQFLEPSLDVHRLEKILLRGRPESRQRRGDDVGQAAGVGDVEGHAGQLVRQHGRQRDDLLEEVGDAAGQRLDLEVPRRGLRLHDLLDARPKERLPLHDLDDPEARDPLHHEAERPVRLL